MCVCQQEGNEYYVMSRSDNKSMNIQLMVRVTAFYVVSARALSKTQRPIPSFRRVSLTGLPL